MIVCTCQVCVHQDVYQDVYQDVNGDAILLYAELVCNEVNGLRYFDYFTLYL